MKMIAEDATQLRAYTTKDLDRKTGGIVKIDFNKHSENLGKLFTLLDRAQNLVEKAPESSLDTLKMALGNLVKLSADQENELLTKLRNIEAPPSVTNATTMKKKIDTLTSKAESYQNPDKSDSKVLGILVSMQILNEDLSFSMFSEIKHYERIISHARRAGHDYLLVNS